MRMNMDTPVKPPQPSRFFQALQPMIVKLYRVAGMVALGAILIGLILFLTGTIFWYFNRTWVRPVILSPEHGKVVAATGALNDARKLQRAAMMERANDDLELKDIERRIAEDEKFIAEHAPLLPAKPSIDTALVRRQVAQDARDRDAAIDQRARIEQGKKELDLTIAELDKQVARAAASPFIRATEEKRVVGFVPYQNLSSVHPGITLYGCDWGLIKCHAVGKVMQLLEGEDQEVHPHDDSIQRGVLVEIDLTDPDAAQENVLFAGSKPFWWL
jgi:hypothetical protein